MQTSPMQKWIAEPNSHYQRRMAKTIEECAELIKICSRIQNQGIDGIDPSTGNSNRDELHKEMADVYAQIDCNLLSFFMNKRPDLFYNRVLEKTRLMAEWESHFN